MTGHKIVLCKTWKFNSKEDGVGDQKVSLSVPYLLRRKQAWAQN